MLKEVLKIMFYRGKKYDAVSYSELNLILDFPKK